MTAIAIGTRVTTGSGLTGVLVETVNVHDIDTDEFSHVLYRVRVDGGYKGSVHVKTATVSPL